jgi:hypothetical protein
MQLVLMPAVCNVGSLQLDHNIRYCGGGLVPAVVKIGEGTVWQFVT